MEPRLPLPDRGPEFRTAESAPSREAVPQSSGYEAGPVISHERHERTGEAAPLAASVDSSVVALPAPADPSSVDSAAMALPQIPDDTPATAHDNEVIEKEWVDKAKRVIAETKDDPYRREQEVSKLQADYLLKRYGRKLGSPQ